MKHRISPDKIRHPDFVPGPIWSLILQTVRTGRGWPLVFFGLPGRGKSTAALLMLDHDSTRTGQYVTGRELVDLEFGAEYSAKLSFRRAWKAAKLCVIDQFGMSETRDLRHDGAGPAKTQVMVDYLEARDGKPLVIVSNKSPEELAEVYDAQVRSRIEGGTPIEFTGPDWRVVNSNRRMGG